MSAEPVIVGRMTPGGSVTDAAGKHFETLAEYQALAPVLLLWSDGTVTWARVVPIPNDAAEVAP